MDAISASDHFDSIDCWQRIVGGLGAAVPCGNRSVKRIFLLVWLVESIKVVYLFSRSNAATVNAICPSYSWNRPCQISKCGIVPVNSSFVTSDCYVFAPAERARLQFTHGFFLHFVFDSIPQSL